MFEMSLTFAVLILLYTLLTIYINSLYIRCKMIEDAY